MRRILAGLFLLLFCTPAFAQVRGEVESFGFNNHYRPNCWTPMVVRIERAEKSGTYQIRVIQEDLDRDKVVFTREITLTGADDGPAPPQRFWMYFIPQPTNNGLYDVSRGTLKELQQQLKVYLCDENGKQLAPLNVTQSIINLEASTGGMMGSGRGTRLVLVVSDGRSQPAFAEYNRALGLQEDVVAVQISPAALPENALGYEAVDSILWLNTPPPDPSLPTEERRMRAIQEYIRTGGRLVISQPAERDATKAWGDLLPVNVIDVVARSTPEPLREMATVKEDPETVRLWQGAQGPFRAARAEPKPGATVTHWMTWDEAGKDRTPFIVRAGYGLGSVTWVAQDLGDPVLSVKLKRGWSHIWDQVFDWKNDTVPQYKETSSPQRDPYDGGQLVDLGTSLLKTDLGAKSRAFVGLAAVFFVVYWLIAGPGIYFYLLAKARAYMSWFLFAAAAIAATAVTVLVVQLVVRGDPELQHVSFIRKAPGQPTVVQSRFGLYIPRDGAQEISLRDTIEGSSSYLTAFAAHPSHLRDNNEFPAYLEYQVAVRDGAGDSVEIDVPYRSTLKKLQAKWIGVMNAAVEGSGKVDGSSAGSIEGTLTNGTGTVLKNVYIAFRGIDDVDRVLYVPTWEKQASLDLKAEFSPSKAKFLGVPGERLGQLEGMPERSEQVHGVIGRRGIEMGWQRYWLSPMRPRGMALSDAQWHDENDQIKRSFPVMSFFGAIPPLKNPNRIDLLRRGGRDLDLSQALSAGQMVVLAESEGPLPLPLEVEGDKVAGNGTIFHQYVLPIDRSAVAELEDEPVGPEQATPPTVTPTPGPEREAT